MTLRFLFVYRTSSLAAVVLLLLLSLSLSSFRSTSVSLVTASSLFDGRETTLIGLVGQDFCMVGTDSTVGSQGIALLQTSSSSSSTMDDKITVLVDPFPDFSTDDDSTKTATSRQGRKQKQKRKRRTNQQTIVATAAGDMADCSRLLQQLAAQCAIREYEDSIGDDVEYISLYGHEHDHDDGASSVNDCNDCLSVEAVARLARGQIASSLRSRSPLKVSLLIGGMQRVVDGDDDKEEEEDQDQADFGTSTIAFVSHQLQQQVQDATRSIQQQEQQEEGERGTVANDSDDVDSHHRHDDVSKESSDDDESSSRHQSSVVRQKQEQRFRPRLYWLDSYGALQSLHYGAHGLGANFLLSILDQGYSTNISREEALQLMQECFKQLRKRYIVNTTPQPPCIKCIDVYGCHVLSK